MPIKAANKKREAATLNVRMSEDLKRSGDLVLEKEGVTVSEAVRGLYRFLEDEQKIPEWLRNGESGKEDLFEQRRRSMRQLVGIVDLPSDFDARSIRHERLSRYLDDRSTDEAVL